jgi:transcriptional regulator with XRE-family HTH domain
MDESRIRRRIVALREKAGMTQADLARLLGFRDRQTVSTIERGDRKVSAAELVKLADIFGIELPFFSDPYTLVDEGRFSWRRNEVPDDEIVQFENRAKRWLALYRHLSLLAEIPVNSLVPTLALNQGSRFEEASAEGEAIARQFDLGRVPAQRLENALSDDLNALVLQVDAPVGISGAACRLGGLNVILINRAEAPARRAFNMAHELFHLATWDQMPPEHIESVRVPRGGNPRPEQLANAFAAGLLLPRSSLEALLDRFPRPEADQRDDDWIKHLATEMGVSGQAMKWRLVDLGELPKARARRIHDDALRMDPVPGTPLPLPFSEPFVERLRWGLEHGHLTVRKAAQLMDMSIDELHALIESHDMPVPFDL